MTGPPIETPVAVSNQLCGVGAGGSTLGAIGGAEGRGGGSAPGATSGRPRMAARILRRSTSFVVGSIEIESSQPILW